MRIITVKEKGAKKRQAEDLQETNQEIWEYTDAPIL